MSTHALALCAQAVQGADGNGVGGADAGGLAHAARSAAEGHLELWGGLALSDPWFLLLVPIGLIALFHGRRRRAREVGRVPALPPALARRSLAQRLAWVPVTLQLAALVLVAVALARPLRGSVQTSSQTEGVDIALVIDRSSSMEHKDLAPDKNRLEVVKEVVRAFASRRMTDREGAADSIALITFSAYPQLLCPFTLDVDAVTGFIDALKPVDNRAEDGTGIGVGLAKAVAVLRETRAKSKVVVLLTDGENNIDVITPADAAQLAAEEGIRVYTVFAGRFVYTVDFFGNQRATEREIDSTDMENIAHVTGGKFFRARDQAELENVYAEIEQLERTPRVEQRFSETYDLYLRFLAPAFLAYVLAWLSALSFARRLP